MKKIILSALIIFTTLSISAQTSVFKVTGNGHTMYIGGTIHILKESDFPLPEEFEQAYKEATTIVFETDAAALEDPKMTARVMKKAMYPEGKTLKTELEKSTYEALEELCEESGFPMLYLQKMKPSMAIITLSLMKLQKMGYSGEGVDAFFEKKSHHEGKELSFLESPEFQIDLLSSMGDKDADNFVKYSIRDIRNIETDFEKIKSSWRNGNDDEMKKQIKMMKTDFPILYKSLLVNRNNNWMKKLTKMMKTEETEFVMVGAMHLYGKEGILYLLEQKGYKVEQL